MPATYPFSVTLTFAAALALLNVWLGLRCSRVRITGKVLVGDGGNPLLETRMRAHANFVEYTPFVLILMGLLEYGAASPRGLFAAGLLYVIARIAHAFGMDQRRTNPLRAGGAFASWGVLVGLAAWAFVLLYTGAPVHTEQML
jgi:uncharacterized membrane protein YecN with MAPEG domain